MIRTEPGRGAGSFGLSRATALTLFRLLLAPAFALAILDAAPVMASLLFALAVASGPLFGALELEFEPGFLGRSQHAAIRRLDPVSSKRLRSGGIADL